MGTSLNKPMPSQCDIKSFSSGAKISMCCSGHLEHFWVPHSHLFFFFYSGNERPQLSWGMRTEKLTEHRERIRIHRSVQNGKSLMMVIVVMVSCTLWKNKLTSLYLTHLQHLDLHSICWQGLSMRPLTQSTIWRGINKENIESYHIIMHLHCLLLDH